MALTRSEIMARIRGSNTTPERLLRRALWRAGLRYRLHSPTVLGRPDVVFPGSRVAVFIDGCFWHGCPEHYVRPRTRSDFWARKLSENVARDSRQISELAGQGWRVCRIWEHRIFENLDGAVCEITAALTDPKWKAGMRWCVIRVSPLGGTPERERWHLTQCNGTGAERVLVRERTAAKWSRRARLSGQRITMRGGTTTS
jgi:DNA mismatch endonuclease (patch repair protein)